MHRFYRDFGRLVALMLLAGTAQAEQKCFNGYAFTLEGNDYRYTEHHEQTLDQGRIRAWQVDYIGPDGNSLATKKMQFSASETVPTYTLEIPAGGYMEGIRHDDDGWTMVRRESADAAVASKAFEIEQPMAGDSGFDILLRQNFDALTAGETLPFRFVAAGRQAVIRLKASKQGETTFEGEPALEFSAALDMFLVGNFVDDLRLIYDPDSKRLLEYRGIGNMHDDSGEVYPVRVSYSRDMPSAAAEAGAPAASCGSLEG